VFAALFPSASITGAPKVSTMGIISGLESDPRGVYCGTGGFGGPDTTGDAQWAFNVAIRTVLIDRERGRAFYGTGGGITYDSTPGGELREALLKAEVLARRTASFELIETMRWTADRGFLLLHRHLERLGSSARYFDIPLDPAEVQAALRAAVAGITGARRSYQRIHEADRSRNHAQPHRRSRATCRSSRSHSGPVPPTRAQWRCKTQLLHLIAPKRIVERFGAATGRS
jgi:hypothetical protein